MEAHVFDEKRKTFGFQEDIEAQNPIGTGENAVSGLRLLLQTCSPLVVPPGIGLVVANGNLS